jgi:DNA-binding XRE family transcriptional regulator
MLADCVGVSTQFIRQLEIGEKSPSLKTASKLASVLGCTVDDLLGKRDAS